MRSSRYLLATVVAACLLAAPTADARPTSSSATIAAAFAYADAWWIGQGPIPPCPFAAQVRVTANLGYDGYASFGGCDVQLDARRWAQWWTLLSTSNRRARRAILVQVCALAIHERGHNLGYRHTEHGIMRPDVSEVPGGCYVWAAGMAR